MQLSLGKEDVKHILLNCQQTRKRERIFKWKMAEHKQEGSLQENIKMY
jgi:hypothetical protein